MRFAVRFVEEGLIAPDPALERVVADEVRALLRPHVPSAVRAAARVLARGEPARPGVGAGLVVTDAKQAEEVADERAAVLVRPTTDPDDAHGMIAAAAVVTEVGGSTSHVAVVSRELGRPCVVGCDSGTVDRLRGRAVTVDGATGEVLEGILPLAAADPAGDADLAVLLDWARAAGRGDLLAAADQT